MRVPGVVLFVAVLLCFFNSAFALNCNDNGSNTTIAGLCVCNSGFHGLSCADTIAADCTARGVDETIATDFPKLNDTVGATTFTHNTLRASILNPFVEFRKFLDLNFTGASDPRCAIGTADSFWTKDVFGESGNDCVDRFFLALPWTSHKQCGFKNDSSNQDSNLLVLTGHLMIKYEDFIDEVDGFNMTRKVSVPYTMTVKFPRTIVVDLLSLNVTSDVHVGAALTGDEYEPDSQILTLQLTTIINFPNAYHPWHTEFTHPAGIKALAGDLRHIGGVMEQTADVLPEASLGVIDCKFTEGTCTQRWNIKLQIDTDNGGNCSFDGNYTVTYRLYTCRGITSPPTDLDCTFTNSTVAFSIATSDICGSVGIRPVVEGKLLAFPNSYSFDDLANNKPHNETRFRLGQYAKLYADINSDGNDITLKFDEIKFFKKDGRAISSIVDSDWTYLYFNRSIFNATAHVANARLDVQDDKKAFSIYFHSSVFKVLPESADTFIISAKATVTFLGNEGETKKRNLEFTYQSSSMDSRAQVGISNGAVVTDNKPSAVVDKDGVAPVTFIASIVGAIAGTLLIVFVVIGFALRVRNQSEKRDAAASPAVSAANIAAATIDVSVNRL